MHNPNTAIGDELGVAFPTTIDALLQEGPALLTAAFHRAGTLDPANRIVAFTGHAEFFGGGMGRKLLLSVAYDHSAPGLDTDLFVKFPRDFGDPLRDLFTPLMQPECRFALLSRRPGFPIAVPKCYFADYDTATASGLLVTARVAYGRGSIEPHHDKCLDYTLADPLAHYQALTRALARLAGEHRAGRLGADVLQRFPFDPGVVDAGSRVPYTPDQLRIKLAALCYFAADVPQLFEPPLRDPAFLERFIADAPMVLDIEDGIRGYLNEQSDCIALCHWNANLDNAWFWTGEDGVLQAGLLDWGSVGQMNIAQAFYGMMCAAETDFLRRHGVDLLNLFAREYQRAGGPAIGIGALADQLRLSIAVLGIAWILDAPALIEREIPQIRTVADRRDPVLRDNFLARAQLQLLMVFLDQWRILDIGAALRNFAARDAA